jgi:hypothetical protein
VKHARSVLLLTLAVAASCPPAVAVAGPIGSPPESSASRPGVDVEPSDGGVAVLDLEEPLAIKLASAFAIGVALGMVRILARNRRRRRWLRVAPQKPATAKPADAEAPASPSTDAAPQPGPAVDDGEPVEDREPARLRHSELFDAEYAQQVVKVERLREAVHCRIALGAPVPGVVRGGQSVPAVEVDRGEHRPAAENR